MTDLQAKILDYLEENNHVGYTTAETPASIAYGIGLHTGPRRIHGPWSGYQSPAQYIIAPLTSLERQGLIAHGSRPDRLSGTAYYITAAGINAE